MYDRLCALRRVGIEREEQASRCSYGKTRTVGTFRTLGYEDMLAIYHKANEE